MNFESQLMQSLCRYIDEHKSDPLPLAKLAKELHLSPSYLQRRFKSLVGVSPKDYLEACRLVALKSNLRKRKSVILARKSVGFKSASRLYERVNTRLGMTPKQYRDHGAAISISYGFISSSLGEILIAATDRGVCALYIGGNREELLMNLSQEFSKAELQLMPQTFRGEFRKWSVALSAYLSGELSKLDLPLDIKGTVFQMKVWKFLQTIPRGSTRSYTEVAKGIGRPAAVRAVARACATNQVSLIIPCHRVIRGTGEISGYRWGAERKLKLLELEKDQSTIR